MRTQLACMWPGLSARRAGRAVKLEGAPTFNGMPLSKRAKRQVGFVLQARPAR